MNLGLNDDQQMLRDSFARFLDSESGMARVRKANEAGGFDPALWQGLAELGTFAMRVPEEAGGLGMGTIDAALVMEEVGRTLASGPIAEAILAARLLGQLGGADLADVTSGAKVATLAFHDIAKQPVQWLAGGAHADLVLARSGSDVVAVSLTQADRKAEENLASNGIGEVDLGKAAHTVLASGKAASDIFAASIEEWKLLSAAALAGLSRQAVKLAAAYACERQAFGVPIGTYQAISHPLADLITDIDGGQLLVWKVIHEIASGEANAGAHIPLALWWNAKTASKAGIQALRTFGGYGLTTEYDIHMYNLRAKAWPLIHGDPARQLEAAGRRLYAGEASVLPDVGSVPIDFDLGEEAHALAREVDEFFERTLTPELKAHAHYSWDGHHPEVHRKLAEAGLLFPAWPKEKGGRGAPPYARHAAAEVWEKHGWSGHATGTTQMVAAMIDKFGSDELKRDVLAPIMRGEAVCSLGYSEPGSGSDVFAAQTKATPEGNGWRIDGTKMFTSGANLSDYVIMLTRTNSDVAKHKGLTMFIVPMKAEGIAVQPVFTFQDERTNITFYDGVKVPELMAPRRSRWRRAHDERRARHGARRRLLEIAGRDDPRGGGIVPRDRARWTPADRRPHRASAAGESLDALPRRRNARAQVAMGGGGEAGATGSGPDVESVFLGEIPRGRQRPARSDRPIVAVEAGGGGDDGQPVLSPRPRHDDLCRNQRSASQHDCRKSAGPAAEQGVSYPLIWHNPLRITVASRSATTHSNESTLPSRQMRVVMASPG